ncbi:MAG: type II toxin-antitoxin system prevent-host-death family antitoxin [Alphaproteobacteria bacterium]|nr:type II toxin-antitoxin system prevent-host-death family antitoxin [Alphaproteobacteria bacterium]
MIVAKISQLKNQLSAYLRKVAAGESVLILDRDRPVARLEPVAGAAADKPLAGLIASGAVRRLPAGFWSQPLPKAEASVVEALLTERREGR